jgi:putative oxidoreductase
MALADTGLLILRLGLALIFMYHAFPKLKMPWKMSKMMKMSTSGIVFLGLVELLGALAIALGLYAEIGALLLALVMLGALYYKIFVWKVPFTTMDKSGWEFDLLLLAGSLAIVFIGAGSLALQIFI